MHVNLLNFSFVSCLVLLFGLQSSFLYSDHRPCKPPALALLCLYYMSDGNMIIKLTLKLKLKSLTGV